MAEKETIMKLKVNLQCQKCYKKVKKVVRNFPQIRDEVYDEKNNVVKIKVLCCNPEKIRDQICCKGCDVIKIIEIVPRPPPPPPPPPPQCQQIFCTQIFCVLCFEGRCGGLCFHGNCGPPRCRCNDGCHSGSRPCNPSHCDQYFSEENASGCSIM